MKMINKVAAVAATVALVGGGMLITSYAQDKGGAEKSADEMPACCKQMMQMMQKGQMNMNMPGMMRGMGPEMMKEMMGQMTPEAMERMQLLMRTPIFLDAPCPIFAQAEKLGLSEEQKKKLGEIENEARAKARAVLTPEQQGKLGNVPDKPVTMMETCPMMKMMQGMQSGQKDESDKTK